MQTASGSPTTNKANLHRSVTKVAFYDRLDQQLHYYYPVMLGKVNSSLLNSGNIIYSMSTVDDGQPFTVAYRLPLTWNICCSCYPAPS